MICSALDLITLWNHFILEKEKEKAKHTHALIPEILCDCLQKYVKQHEQLQKSGTHSIVCMSPKSENGTVALRFVRTCNDKVVKPLSATRQSTRIFVCVLIFFYDLFCGIFKKCKTSATCRQILFPFSCLAWWCRLHHASSALECWGADGLHGDGDALLVMQQPHVHLARPVW